MDLINRLKHFMSSSNVTISQFADKCGIPRPTMSQLINGRNKRISDEVINKIHNAYPNLSILWLMFGEGSMESASNIQTSEPQNAENRTVHPSQPTINHENTLLKTEQNIFSNHGANSESFENLLFDTPQTEEIRSDYIISNESSVNDHNILFDTATSNEQPTSQPYQQSFFQPQQSTQNDNAPITQPQTNYTSTSATQTTLADDRLDDKKISISPDAHKKITNIVVFYSDNSFQSFLPDA